MKKLSFLGILVLLMLTTGLALAQSRPSGIALAPLDSGAAQAATATASAPVSITLPTISGTTEIALDPAIKAEIAKQLPAQLSNAAFKLFVSDDAGDKLAGSADTALTGAGYTFGVPGQTKPVEQSGSYIGFYTKANSPDVLFAITAVPTDTNQLNNLNIPGITAADAQKFIDQVKGHKTLAVVIGAPNLVQALTQLSSGPTQATTPTAAPLVTTGATAAATATPSTRVTVGTNASVTIRATGSPAAASATKAPAQGGAPASGFGGEANQGDGFSSGIILLALLALLVASGAGYIVSRSRR